MKNPNDAEFNMKCDLCGSDYKAYGETGQWNRVVFTNRHPNNRGAKSCGYDMCPMCRGIFEDLMAELHMYGSRAVFRRNAQHPVVKID